MKKPILLCALALFLTSCDLSSFMPGNNGNNNGASEKNNHDGVSLNLSCSDDMGLKRVGDKDYVTNLNIEPETIGISTIKRLDGHITFYKPPIFGQGQLEEITNNEGNLQSYFVETQINFVHADDSKNLDFVYLTSVDFSCKDPENVFYKNLRVAIFDKDEMTDCFVLSYDKDGSTCKTEYNLDLNMDGELDKTQGFNTNPELINYTTGLPAYYTDPWDLVVPTQSDVEQNKFDPFYQRLSVANNKPVTIRMWIEGWELENNVAYDSMQTDISLKFAGHIAK